MTARFMRDFFDFLPTHKLMIAGNHKPKLQVVDEAIRSRFNLVPFTVTIPKEERDTQLTEKLRPEYPGILRWMIEGCLAWREQGLGAPPAIREASNDYFHSQDSVAHRLDDRTERRQMAYTRSGDLYDDWGKWAKERGIEIGSSKAFVQALKDRGWVWKRTENGSVFNDLVLKGAAAGGDDILIAHNVNEAS
jgi:putative DNA primase/helicase